MGARLRPCVACEGPRGRPSFDNAESLLAGAFAIAIMVFLETVAVARASVRRTSEPPIDNDQELVAAASRASPARCSAPCLRPAVSRRPPSTCAPAQDPAQRVRHRRPRRGCALFLGSRLSELPQATLGCMVLVAVVGLIQPGVRRYLKLSRLEFWVGVVIVAGSGLCSSGCSSRYSSVCCSRFFPRAASKPRPRWTLTELQPDASRTGTCRRRDLGTRRRFPGLLILRFERTALRRERALGRQEGAARRRRWAPAPRSSCSTRRRSRR